MDYLQELATDLVFFLYLIEGIPAAGQRRVVAGLSIEIRVEDSIQGVADSSPDLLLGADQSCIQGKYIQGLATK